MIPARAPRQLALRLDSGLVIRAEGGGAVRLSPAAAFEAGLLREEHVAKLEGLISQLRARPPSRGQQQLTGATEVGQKRKSVELGEAGASKRPAVSPFGNDNTALPTASGSQGGSSFGAPRHTNFEKTCGTILKKVKEELGKDTVVFDRPVDRTLLPDYYRVVTKPMDLGRIAKKLERHEYSAPQDFCEDMRQVWTNCALYNRKEDYVGKVGARADACFERLWAATGFESGARIRRRATAGIAAPKYEPAVEPLEKKPSQRNANSGKSLRTATGAQLQRQKSVASRGDMPMERMQELADILSSMEGDAMQEALAIIRTSNQGVDQTDGDDEIELDFQALDPSTLWSLDDYIRALPGVGGGGAGGGGGGGAGGSGNGQPVMANSDSDSESDSASE